jgi:hypothetical protein
MPTKDHKRHARGILESLESRAHAGPSVCPDEIQSARAFLEQHDFSPASDYFGRLARLQSCVTRRPARARAEKRNYGGEAAGCWMQLQSIYDHVILSVCYDGEFNSRRGRIKLSHRFNEAGRIDFVELKFLRSMQPCLNGEIRKLLLVQGFPTHRKDWHEAEAHVLRVLPQELVFLYPDFFRIPRLEIFAWLINIGHRTVGDLLGEMRAGRVNGHVRETGESPNQLRLAEVESDEVAVPILEQASTLESTVESTDPESVVVRYVHT